MKSNRSVAFSGKKKKEQLQLKKLKKQATRNEVEDTENNTQAPTRPVKARTKINLKSEWDVRGGSSSRLAPRDNPLYQTPIEGVKDETWRGSTFETVFGKESASLSIPTRPQWTSEMSKEELEAAEVSYFHSWIQSIYSAASADPSRLSFFEQNLEVWRQLWRVCEVAQVLVVVSDIRNPLIHLPPSFISYCRDTLNKPIIIVLTKADLIGKELRMAWLEYLQKQLPGVIIHFSSIYPLEETASTKRYSNHEQVKGLLEHVKAFSDPQFTPEWDQIINNPNRKHHSKNGNSSIDKLFTIGFIGQPNVGKSSLINTIFGSKVVSASRTPGHTKHFQTLHLSTHIRVCDSPGLIFPSFMDQQVQILMGLYNVAQVRDPYGPLLYLTQRIDLPRILKLPAPLDEAYSIFSICEAFAVKCGFLTSKAGRPDTYRAANFILRMLGEGKIVLAWHPPGYTGAILNKTPINPSESDSEYSNESVQESDESDGLESLSLEFQGGAFSILASDEEEEEEEE